MNEKTIGILDLGAPSTWLAKLRDKLRAMPLFGLFVIALLITLTIAPPALGEVKIGAAVWGLVKLAMGAYLGYWIDRLVFPYARPHTLEGSAAEASWRRRSMIVAAAVIAAGMIG